MVEISDQIKNQIRRAHLAVTTDEKWDLCGCCGSWHPVNIPGDCREDWHRLPIDPVSYLLDLDEDEVSWMSEVGISISREKLESLPDYYNMS